MADTQAHLGTCFVVMPFGKKRVGGRWLDFDPIYSGLIEPAAARAGYKVSRADSAGMGTLIIPELMQHLLLDDVVIADVTQHNPNVFYEVGVRHALRRDGTVVIRQEIKPGRRSRDHELPFDFQGIRVHKYDVGQKSNLDDEIAKLQNVITRQMTDNKLDSPVYNAVPSLEIRVGRSQPPANPSLDRTYQVAGVDGVFVGIRAGDIDELKGERAADFWVNSENVFMQMARMQERAVSATIRHLGAANSDAASTGFQDTIDDALREAMRLEGTHRVSPGRVLKTTSGRLADTHGVKAILHAATVTGEFGRGWRSVDVEDLVKAVRTAIEVADAHLDQESPSEHRIPSIVIPFFATGQGRDPGSGELRMIAGRLAWAMIDQLRTLAKRRSADDRPGRRLRAAFLSAYSMETVALMRNVFDALVEDGELVSQDRALPLDL